MSRLNIVREIKQKNLKNNVEYEKEIKWDNRFFLGKLPEYNAYKDSNCILFYHNLVLNIRMLREQIKNSEGLKKRTHMTSSRGKRLVTPICQNLDDLVSPCQIPPIVQKFDEDYDDDEYYKEEMNILISIWDDLGVNEDYRLIFENVARQLSGALRKEFFDFEIGSLKRFSDNLTKVAKEIQNREKAILLMQKLDDAVISEKNPNVIEKILSDVIQCIKNLRIHSINIVNHFSKIREICSYYVMSGKYNLDKISKAYVFDRNYLVKMRFDLDFLKNSSLAKYFNFSEEADPFFLSLADEVQCEDENNKKFSVGLNEDMLKSIRQCQFIIMQDLIFYQIQSSKLIPIQSQLGTSYSKSPQYKLNYPLAKDPNKQKTSRGFYNLSVTKNHPKYNSLFFNKNANDKKIKIEVKNKETSDSIRVGNSNNHYINDHKTQENWMTFKNIKLEQEKNAYNRSKEREDIGHLNRGINENAIDEIADTSCKGKYSGIYYNERKDIEKLKENLVIKHTSKERNDNDSSSKSLIKRQEDKQSHKEENDSSHKDQHQDDHRHDKKEKHKQNHKHDHDHKESPKKDSQRKENECQEIIPCQNEEKKINEIDDDNYNFNNFNEVNDDYIDEIISEEKNVKNTNCLQNSKKVEEHNESQKEKEKEIHHHHNEPVKEEILENIKEPIESVDKPTEKPQTAKYESSVKRQEEEQVSPKPVEKGDDHENSKEITDEVHKQAQELVEKKEDDLSPLAEREQEANEKEKEAPKIMELERDKDQEATKIKDERNQVSENVKGVTSMDMEVEGETDKESQVKVDQSKTENIESTFQVSFFADDLLQFETPYSQYYSKITNDQVITFIPPQDSSFFSKGLNPKLLVCYQKTHQESTLIGVCSLSYVSLHDSGLKLNINSITTIYSDFEKIFTLFIEYIKTNFILDELMIDLHYEYREGGFCINTKIRDFFKNQLKFRWLKLENSSRSERFQKMSLRFQKCEEDQEKFKAIKECLRVKVSAVILVEERAASLGDRSSQEEDKFLSIFTVLASAYQLKEDSFSLTSDNEKKVNLNIHQLKKLLGKSISSTTGQNDEILEFLSENHIDKTSINNMTEDNEYCSSVFTVLTQFPNSISTLHEVNGIQYYYNRIKGPFEVLYEKSTDQTFFLVPTGDQVNSVLIAQLTPSMKDYLLSNNGNIYTNFSDIYQKIEQKEKEKEKEHTVFDHDNTNQILWLPSFSSEKHIKAHNPKVLDDIQITKNDTSYRIAYSEEYSSLDYHYDESTSNSFKMKVNPSDMLITDTFLFAIINVEILTETSIPVVFMEVITTDKWKRPL